MPKSVDPQVRETRILDAAAELFIQFGFDKTTVSDIARAAGISKGAIYLHFKSKDALFEALLLRETQNYTDKWLASIDADPQGGTMAGLYKSVLIALNQNPFMAALFKKDRHVLGQYLRNPEAKMRTQSHGATRHEFVKLMQDCGAMRQDISPEIVAHIMNMLAFGLVSMEDIMSPQDIPATEMIIEGIAEIMDRALTPDDQQASEKGKAVVHQIVAQAKARFEQEKQEKTGETQND